MTLSVAYVGDKGTHLVTYYNYNRQVYGALPCGASAPTGCNFPNLGTINTQATIGTSNYNAMQVALNRRFSAGLQFGAAYTWSHTIDDSPGAFDNYVANGASPVNYRDLAAERASSNIDARNRLVLNGIYQLPFGQGMRWGGDWNGVTNAFLGGWQTNLIFVAQSGTPFDIVEPGNPATRPDIVGNPFAGATGLYYFNPAAFAPVPTDSSGVALRAGTLGRNALVGPAFTNVDFATFKNFKITERVTTQFRAEFFNLLNTPHFVQPDYNTQDGNFGKLTATEISSSRQIQFALKVLF
jgi:hypothetical protein